MTITSPLFLGLGLHVLILSSIILNRIWLII